MTRAYIVKSVGRPLGQITFIGKKRRVIRLFEIKGKKLSFLILILNINLKLGLTKKSLHFKEFAVKKSS